MFFFITYERTTGFLSSNIQRAGLAYLVKACGQTDKDILDIQNPSVVRQAFCPLGQKVTELILSPNTSLLLYLFKHVSDHF